jgi:hypothetical protein
MGSVRFFPPPGYPDAPDENSEQFVGFRHRRRDPFGLEKWQRLDLTQSMTGFAQCL